MDQKLGGPEERRDFKPRPAIFKDMDIEELGLKAAAGRAGNDGSSKCMSESVCVV